MWQWEVAYHDIAFHAAFVQRRRSAGGKKDGVEGEEDVCPWARHKASAGMVEGSVVLPGGEDGGGPQLLLTWDNT